MDAAATENITTAQEPQNGVDEAQKVAVLVILCLFAVFGVVGNALAFYIYYKKRDKTTSNVFILVLAATDFIVCLIVVPYTIVAELIEYEFVFDILCKVYMFFITSNIPLSAFIMTAIAFDRYFCICHPFLRVLTVSRAKYTCAILSIFAAFLGIVPALSHGVYALEEVNKTDVTNATSNDANVTDVGYASNETVQEKEYIIVHTGYCFPNELMMSFKYVEIYQKLYAATFLLSLLLVAVLYALIYRSILVRRRWKNKRKRMSCYNGIETTAGAEETQLTTVNGDNIIDEKKAKKPYHNRQAAIREKTLYANVKTAAMLFVVTVVFVFSFLPAWLMGLRLIPQNIIIFNLYFLNNVANPVIYAFMNRTFRDDLKALIKGCK